MDTKQPDSSAPIPAFLGATPAANPNVFGVTETTPIAVPTTPIHTHAAPVAVPVAEPVPVVPVMAENPAEPAVPTPPESLFKVTQDSPCYSPIDPKAKVSDLVLIAMPSAPRAETAAVFRGRTPPNEHSPEGTKRWFDLLMEAQKLYTRNDEFTSSLVRPGSNWRQTLASSQSGELGIGRPSFKPGEGKILTGERALMRINAVIHGGGMVQIPLYHSGFWITIRTPSEATLLDLERRIVQEKITMGRITNGAVFSNMSVYLAAYITDVVMDHLYDSTLVDKDAVRESIVTHDLQATTWGLACAVWPSGFEYSRSVITGDSSDYDIVREKINVGKLLWVDNNALTEWQVSHMAKRTSASHTSDSLRRYREEFTNRVRRVELTDDVAIQLRVPMMDEYINSGTAWIDKIATIVSSTFTNDEDESVRNAYITAHSQASHLQQYQHWIAKIEVAGEEVVDQESIGLVLASLSSKELIRKKCISEVIKFMDDTAISVIAVPTITDHEENKFPRFPKLFPIDAISTFFTLFGQTLQRIRYR